MRQTNFDNLESYYTICLDSKITKLFSSAMLGIDYWKKHKHHTCYQCRQKGHLASVCKQICPHCKNYHPGLPICIWKILNFFEKIHEILNKKQCKRITDRYMKIVEEENKINNELNNISIKEVKSKNDIKKYNDLCIQNNSKIQYNGGDVYLFHKAYQLEDKKYENYVLAKNKTNTSKIYQLYSWFKNRIFGVNNVVVASRIQYLSERTCEEDCVLTIDSARITSIKGEKNKITGFCENIQCIMPSRKEWLNKIGKEALENIKKRKKKIEATNRFAFDKVYEKIKTVKDLTKSIENLKDKQCQLRAQNEEIMENIDRKKNNMNKLKKRMNHINNEKNNILNAARRKGERIKKKAYNDYKYWFGKKNEYYKCSNDDESYDDDDNEYDY